MALWNFVGRSAELARLTAAATSSSGRGLIFSGDAGIGKSRILREVVKRLPSDQFAVWQASGNIATSGLPFGGLAQVLPADQPAGLSAAGVLRWALDALQQQAAGRTMVLAIDDAHLLDPSSAALVYLIAHGENAKVLCTVRSGEEIPLSIRALWRDDLVEHTALGPMPLAEAHEMVNGLLEEGTLDSISADKLYKYTQGNALMLRELVLAGITTNELSKNEYGTWSWAGTGELGLAPSLEELIDDRIGQLTPGVRRVLELVAFGEPIGMRLLLQIVEPTDVENALERELIRELHDDRRRNVRLGHPLYGDLVRKRCPAVRTRRLKATLADLLEQVGNNRRDDLLRLAVWRLDSDTAQDPELLLRAAGQAFGRFDVPLAARLARAALDKNGKFEAAEQLATILMFTDQPREAITVLDKVVDQGTTDEQRGRWLTVRGMVTYWGLSQQSTIKEISAEADRLDHPPARARVRAFEAIMRLHQLDLVEALRLSRAVLDRPAATVAARGLARCTIAHLQAARGELLHSGRAIAGVAADEAAWRDDMPYLQLALELARGTRLALAGDLTGIDEIVAAEFADLAVAGDFRLGSGYLSILRAQAARLRGRTGDALTTSTDACAMLTTSRVFAGLAHAERAHAAALRGETAEATEAMAASDRAHWDGMMILYPWREQARAAVIAATGNLEGAAGHLSKLVDRLRTDGLSAHEVLALHDLVRLDRADLEIGRETRDGRRQTVAHRLTELTETVEGVLPPLLARHARAVAARSGEELLAVANDFDELDLGLFAAEATAMAVARLRERKSPRAHEANVRLGALLERCDTVRSPALIAEQPALTDRERQIARLAAGGVPSRNIAEQLYISTRTVENHLQRVYAKLGVTGRGELWPALRALPDHDGKPTA
ncbi:LuxR C-terminal-related transcriptional regulator [Micromonospora sp. NPDC050397]|uniref:LuxR C-terminal-related transcriptional regulator n=1 Tax=Micromonospora sp. NPDC050397 TaxID=3364279 RepID=UPI00384D87FF